MGKNYLYRDNETGEEFYVKTDNRHDADIIAKNWFNDPEFIGVDDDYTAELYGYDTYTE